MFHFRIFFISCSIVVIEVKHTLLPILFIILHFSQSKILFVIMELRHHNSRNHYFLHYCREVIIYVNYEYIFYLEKKKKKQVMQSWLTLVSPKGTYKRATF